MKKMVKGLLVLATIIMVVIIGTTMVKAETGNKEIDRVVSNVERKLTSEEAKEEGCVFEKIEVIKHGDVYVLALKWIDVYECPMIEMAVLDEYANPIFGGYYDIDCGELYWTSDSNEFDLQ